MMDKSRRKERVFGEAWNDSKPRMRGHKIIDEGINQGLSPMDMLLKTGKTIGRAGNLKNAN